MTPAVERLVKALRVLPGVGKKTATRYAYALLQAPPEAAAAVADAVREVRERVVPCSRCHNWTETDPCEICEQRAGAIQVCVVESPGDVLAIERTSRFRGRYHVLHGTLDPMAGVTLDDLTVDALVERVKREGIPELLLALSPTREGEATCRLIATLLSDTEVKLSRLAYGLPLGSHLSYLDEGTLGLALDHRRDYPEGY